MEAYSPPRGRSSGSGRCRAPAGSGHELRSCHSSGGNSCTGRTRPVTIETHVSSGTLAGSGSPIADARATSTPRWARAPRPPSRRSPPELPDWPRANAPVHPRRRPGRFESGGQQRTDDAGQDVPRTRRRGPRTARVVDEHPARRLRDHRCSPLEQDRHAPFRGQSTRRRDPVGCRCDAREPLEFAGVRSQQGRRGAVPGRDRGASRADSDRRRRPAPERRSRARSATPRTRRRRCRSRGRPPTPAPARPPPVTAPPPPRASADDLVRRPAA